MIRSRTWPGVSGSSAHDIRNMRGPWRACSTGIGATPTVTEREHALAKRMKELRGTRIMGQRRPASHYVGRYTKARLLPLVLVAVLTAAPPVAANGLPLGVLGSVGRSAGGVLYPASNTPISVIDETLVLDLRQDDVRRIRATYRMRNNSKQPVNVLTAFPVPVGVERGLPRAWLDGQPLAVAQPTAPVELETLDVALDLDWLDPFTGAAYRPPNSSDHRASDTPLVTFTVPFAPEQTSLLEVEYAPDASRDYSRFVAPAWRYDYLLQPARHWASFGTLHVELLAPVDRAVAVRPALARVAPGRYVADFPGLPEGNLSVFVAPGTGSGAAGSWWWQRSGRPLLLELLLAVGTVVAAASRRWVHPLVGGTALAATGLGFVLYTPPHLFQPDPFGFMQTWFFFAPLSLTGSLLVYRILWPATRGAAPPM